jgi:hypothetical protein
MNEAVVGVDDELSIEPVGVFVSADQKFECEMFEDKIVCGFNFIVGSGPSTALGSVMSWTSSSSASWVSKDSTVVPSRV